MVILWKVRWGTATDRWHIHTYLIFLLNTAAMARRLLASKLLHLAVSRPTCSKLAQNRIDINIVRDAFVWSGFDLILVNMIAVSPVRGGCRLSSVCEMWFACTTESECE